MLYHLKCVKGGGLITSVNALQKGNEIMHTIIIHFNYLESLSHACNQNKY